jgi:hypothetical protein
MKIRTSFVANSSSSSFIVGFPRIPTEVIDLEYMLFPETDTFRNPYSDMVIEPDGSITIRNAGWTTTIVSEVVYSNIVGKIPASDEEIEDILNSGVWNGSLLENCVEKKPKGMNHEETHQYWIALEEARKLESKNKIIELRKKLGDNIFIIHIWDDTDLGAAMEHGTLFNNLPHLRVSRH